MKFLASIALPLYALDQATKLWIVNHFELHEQRTVISNFFDLVYYSNTGAAFSALTGKNTFFILISIVALVALLVFYKKGAFKDRPSRWASALLCAGILGNLTDRIVHGHVVDFLLFNLHVRYADPWPAFNVADSCICIATGLFIISAMFDRKPEAATPQESPDEASKSDGK
ncbi:lipoprotein signal peptidase [Chthoniobacter flavus Ellin428]|uniref:Lipoprotein signal peptidase n=1 Tax=Chthoniobacter flavus Ellin428 TaxID=497964 RepID=B4CVV9_9BACT|nr:signal peptidase II [Chthoniobacter flavus]EDY21551.1 lipoprotein signal peptidase [Chthoniobacter flavus Ellin428]TCO95496.1 signal peptidase II [Chthoniobacter flavus]